MHAIARIAPERWAIASIFCALGAPLVAAALAGFGAGMPLAIAGGLLAAALALRPIARGLPDEFDRMLTQRPLLCLGWLLLATLAVLRVAGVGLFMLDPARAQASAFWFDDFYTGHSCYSALWKAAVLARDGVANVYDVEHYGGFEGRFKLDEYMYFPQFLLLPRAAIAAGGTFESMRALWFALEGALVMAAMVGACRFAGGRAGRLGLLFIPLVWVGSPMVVTLQVGNFQLAAVALSVLAMLAFARGRNAAGGAMLGFAVFKLFPGILGVYLLCTRRWRAAAWTAGFSALYTVLVYAWMGSAPYDAFLHYQLPRMLSGDAWGFLDIPQLGAVVAINDSIPGLLLKLRLLHVDGMTRALQGMAAWIWTGAVVGLTALAAWRTPRLPRLEQAGVWLALLSLAAYRSPFVPDHNGLFAPLWLWGLVTAAAFARMPRVSPAAVTVAMLGWLVLATVLPFGGMPLPGDVTRMLISTTSQALATGLCLWLLLRRPRYAEAAQPAFDTPSLSPAFS